MTYEINERIDHIAAVADALDQNAYLPTQYVNGPVSVPLDALTTGNVFPFEGAVFIEPCFIPKQIGLAVKAIQTITKSMYPFLIHPEMEEKHAEGLLYLTTPLLM